MGMGQSARILTIDNEEDTNVIQVSNSVVKRLAQNAKAKTAEPVNEVRTASLTQPSTNNVVSAPSSRSGNIPVTSGYPVYYYPQLTLTALEIQQQKENELLSQDQYWQKRLENLEKNHSKINQIMDDEYKKAAEELYINKDQKSVNIQDSVQPCLESTEKVLKCYQEYPKQILMCSDLVEEFSNCVDQRRMRVISARC